MTFGRSRRYFQAAWPPLLLVALFMLQNRIFNLWLNIHEPGDLLKQTIVTCALGMLLFGPAVLLNKHWRYIYLGIVSCAISLIFISQYLYFTYSGGFLQASSLMYSREAMYVTGTIERLLTWRLLLFVVGPLAVLSVFLLTRKRQPHPQLVHWEKICAAALIVALFWSGFVYLHAAESKEIVNTVNLFSSGKLYSLDTMVARTGVVNYFLQDAVRFATSRHGATPEQQQFVSDWNAARPASAPTDKTFGMLRGRNLIFIQVESLENAVIGKKIGNQEITPRLNQLTKNGMYFDNYYSMIGPGNTADAEFITLNSLYALPDEVAFVSHAYDDYRALPSLLKQNGYATYALHGDVPSFWNRANIYPRLGYQTIMSREDFTVPRPVCYEGLCDNDFLQQAADKMKSFPQPFMATVITLSSHTPFELPDDLKTLDIPSDMQLTWQQRGYLESIHYADAAIGAFIDRLKQEELYDDSLIFIYGDHESFTDIRSILEPSQLALTSEFDKNQVPLILLAPHTDLTGTNSTPGSHLDLYPTASSLLGLKAPFTVLGQDILGDQMHVVVERELSSGNIRGILTPSLFYRFSADNAAEQGTCWDATGTKSLPLDDCGVLLKQQSDAVSISDVVVKDNLLDLLSSK